MAVKMEPRKKQALLEQTIQHELNEHYTKAYKCLKKIIEARETLTYQQLVMLTAYFKGEVKSLRKNGFFYKHVRILRQNEARKLSAKYLKLLRRYLVPPSEDDYEPESLVLFQLFSADIYRYKAEFEAKNSFDAYLTISHEHYKVAFVRAITQLPPFHYTRLALCLNYANILHNHLNCSCLAVDILKWSLKEVDILPNSSDIKKKCEGKLNLLRLGLAFICKNLDLDWTGSSQTNLSTNTKLLLFINIEEYDDASSTRVGADVESIRIYTAFKSRDYDIYPKNCLEIKSWTEESILDQVEKFKIECLKKLADQVVVYVAAHGTTDSIVTSSGKLLTDAVFLNTMCTKKFPIMANKPKLIICNCCRAISNIKKNTDACLEGTVEELVVIHSALSGTVSKRHLSSGSMLSRAITKAMIDSRPITLTNLCKKISLHLKNDKTTSQQIVVCQVGGLWNLDYFI